MKVLICVSVLASLAFGRISSGKPAAPAVPQPDEAFRASIAKHFAPYIYQNTEDSRLDFMTNFNFDGNWNPLDQEENAADTSMKLKAYVYHSVVAGKRHYFVGYAIYHPKDYKALFDHESDFEGVLFVIERQSNGQWGELLAAETLAHDEIYQYRKHAGVRDREQDIDSNLSIEDPSVPGVHPMIIVEAKGHGVYAYGHNLSPGQTVVRYEPGENAEEPSGPDDNNVNYALEDLLTNHLWMKRRDLATYRDPYEQWTGQERETDPARRFLGKLQGRAPAVGGARPPWAWDDRNDGVIKRGDWFIAPAFAFAHHLHIPNLRDNELNLADYYDSNGFLEGGKGTNPPFLAATVETIPQEARSTGRPGETAHTFASKALERWVPAGHRRTIEGTAPGSPLRLFGLGAGRKPDEVAQLESPNLTVPLGVENFLLLRYRNPYGVPAANVTFSYSATPKDPVKVESRLILLPSLTAQRGAVSAEAGIDQVKELILTLPEGSSQTLRKVTINFTSNVSEFTRGGARPLPQLVRDQLEIFSRTSLAERSIDIISLGIVTRAPGTTGGR
jgi:hypothetical protein